MAYGIQGVTPVPLTYSEISPASETLVSAFPEGELTIRDPALSGVAMLQFAYAMPEGMTVDSRRDQMEALPKDSPDWYRIRQTWPGMTLDQGYFGTIADAQRLIEVARRTTSLPTIAEMLTQAGFVAGTSLDPGTQIYKRSVGRHAFSLFLSDTSVWLTFERYGTRSWRNLVRLATEIEGYNFQSIPCPWPSFMNSHAVHVMLACQMADDYVSAERTASTRKSPAKAA